MMHRLQRPSGPTQHNGGPRNTTVSAPNRSMMRLSTSMLRWWICLSSRQVVQVVELLWPVLP